MCTGWSPPPNLNPLTLCAFPFWPMKLPAINPGLSDRPESVSCQWVTWQCLPGVFLQQLTNCRSSDRQTHPSTLRLQADRQSESLIEAWFICTLSHQRRGLLLNALGIWASPKSSTWLLHTSVHSYAPRERRLGVHKYCFLFCCLILPTVLPGLLVPRRMIMMDRSSLMWTRAAEETAK